MDFPETTDERPTGVEPFDHSDFADLPEYQALAAAMDALVHAVRRRDDVMLPQPDWLRALAQIGAAVPFADCCKQCRALTYPSAATIEKRADALGGDWLTGYYRCACGTTWTMGWATGAPALF